MKEMSREELIRRIAKLARQNKDLEELLKKLEKQNLKLLAENDRLKEEKVVSNAFPVDDYSSERKEKALRYNMVTVLFANVQGLSKIADDTNSAAKIDELDELFLQFDEITSQLKIEKIRTIGDTFMCAGGIPEKNITNPVQVVLAALKMRNLLEDFEHQRRDRGSKIWEIKTGIHTGPVSAYVAGKKRVSYDIKGDTVNNASRIEGLSDEGEILISAMTYELVKELFECEYHGSLPVKYKGDLQVFNVIGLKPALSADGKGKEPNNAFSVQYGLIQFTDIQEVVLDKLEKELPGYLFYHNVKHTVDVVTEVELIGWSEGCTDEEILILKTAALFHDTGHTVAYDNHEYHGALFAREVLPKYNYNPQQVEIICSLIMSTTLPPRPANLLEEILCDSDLDYLGRSDFIPVSNTLFEELKALGKMKDLNAWNKLQVKFISGHQYFTKTARSLREVNKQLQIERIKNEIISQTEI